MSDLIEAKKTIRKPVFPTEMQNLACQILDNIRSHQVPANSHDKWTVLEDLLLIAEKMKNKNYPELPRSKQSKKMRKARLKSYKLRINHLECVRQLQNYGFELRELTFINEKIMIREKFSQKTLEEELTNGEIIALD